LQCKSTVDVGGEVDSMLMESGFLIVGLHASGTDFRTSRGGIHVYKLQDGSMNALEGHQVCPPPPTHTHTHTRTLTD
jgi:hypothetical protein